MALFLAGMRGVPDDLREAARVDGASEPKVFWYVVRPMLLPVIMSALVILAHISLKTFDLVFAMDVESRKIETPALYMWFTTFDGLNFSTGAAIATLLVLGIAVVTVPYIWYTIRVGAPDMSAATTRRTPSTRIQSRWSPATSLPARYVVLFALSASS